MKRPLLGADVRDCSTYVDAAVVRGEQVGSGRDTSNV